MNAPQPEPAPPQHPEAAPKPAARRGLLRRVTSGVVKLGIVAAVPALTLLAATRYLPSGYYTIDIASNFQVHYLVAGLAFAGLAALLRFRIGVLMALALVLFQVPAFWPYYFGGETRATESHLRVGIANLFGGNRHYQTFGDWVQETRPDVLLLQETEMLWPAYLAILEAEYPHTGKVTHPTWGFDAQVMSRLPILSHEIVPIQHDAFPMQRVVLNVAGKEIALYNFHLFMSGKVRDAQNLHLRKILDAEELPHVVAGDFNATPWAASQRDLFADSHLRNAAYGFGYQPTWPARMMPLVHFIYIALLRRSSDTLKESPPETVAPHFARFLGIPIDHAYVCPGIGVADYSRGPGIHSDHLPILLDLHVR